MDRANQTTEAKPRNPLKRGRWAGEKSRVRVSIVGPMSDRGPRDAETRGEQKISFGRPRVVAGSRTVMSTRGKVARGKPAYDDATEIYGRSAHPSGLRPEDNAVG